MKGIRKKSDGLLRSFWEPSEDMQGQEPIDDTEEIVELKPFELNRELVQYADENGNVMQKPLEDRAVVATGLDGLREGLEQNVLNKPQNANITVADLLKLLNMSNNGEIFKRGKL